MESGTLSSSEFAEWSKSVVLFCHVTSRVQSDKHQDLLTRKGGNGFPYLIVMDGAGTVLARHDADRTIAAFDATLKSAEKTAKSLAELEAKSAQGDAAAKKELLRTRISLGQLNFEQASAALKELTLSDAEKADFEKTLVNLEASEILNGVVSAETHAAAGKRLAQMLAAGRIPSEEQLAGGYWQGILKHAEKEADIALYERGLTELRKMFGSDARAKPYFDDWEKTLEAMRAKKG
ncbi:MAG: hypothetical protein L0Z55_04675 [Planctomycetes bacterium]|nr:hypothetical protein [Planctomycetota bacterium]